MKAFLIKLIGFFIFIIAFILVYGFFCEWFFSSKKFLNHVDNKRAWCLKKENTRHDYAVLGSSRGYGAFDMRMLDSLTQLNGINISANGSSYFDNYLIFKKFVESGNSTRYLFLQIDIYSLNSKDNFSNAFHVYQFLPYWSDKEIRTVIINSLDQPERAIWQGFPFIAYIQYNKYFSVSEVLKGIKASKKTNSPFDELKGGTPNIENDTLFSVETKAGDIKAMIDPRDLEALNKIINLAAEQKMKVILFRAPELLDFANQIPNYALTLKEIESIAKERDLDYIESSRKIEENRFLFKNPNHVNTTGKILFTNEFFHGVESQLR